MTILANTWIVWLVLSGVIGGMMVFYRDSRRSAPAAGMFTSHEEFSIKNILFGFRRGEGDLFVGYLGAMICFSLFLAGFIRWVKTVF